MWRWLKPRPSSESTLRLVSIPRSGRDWAFVEPMYILTDFCKVWTTSKYSIGFFLTINPLISRQPPTGSRLSISLSSESFHSYRQTGALDFSGFQDPSSSSAYSHSLIRIWGTIPTRTERGSPPGSDRKQRIWAPSDAQCLLTR